MFSLIDSQLFSYSLKYFCFYCVEKEYILCDHSDHTQTGIIFQFRKHLSALSLMLIGFHYISVPFFTTFNLISVCC